MGVSARAMLAALIAGERDPRVLAELAKGRLRVKNPALIEALTGRFDEHHAELADILLGQIDSLTAQIEWLDTRAEQIIADIPAAQARPTPAASTTSDTPPAYLAAVDRLDEITGIGRHAAQTIIAEIGLSMDVFPTSAHLVSWSASRSALRAWSRCQPASSHNSSRTLALPTRDADRYRVAVAFVTALRWLIVSPMSEAGPTPTGNRPATP